MKILAAVSRSTVARVLNCIQVLVPKPHVAVVSLDEEAALASKAMGVEFIGGPLPEKIYAIDEFKEYDVGIAALDNDSINISVVKALRSIGIPLVISLLNNSANRDLLVKEGADYVIDIDSYVSQNIAASLSMDKWVYVKPLSIVNLTLAVVRLARRSILGVKLGELKSALRSKSIHLMAIDRLGKVISDDSVELNAGDIILLTGIESEVYEASMDVEKLFRRHEETLARSFAESLRASTRPYG
ncbi:MAG: hypothetical protein N3E36_01785 [Sulfolobales archaeon]|nr:hypothetical protein [Sulfolobales archaeon]MCX8198745.1 hypothetical protein [Sulfolobales archaeon]MDW8169818.1 hypothetical protein [Desulfurococcaceae archaeon]